MDNFSIKFNQGYVIMFKKLKQLTARQWLDMIDKGLTLGMLLGIFTILNEMTKVLVKLVETLQEKGLV